MLIMNIKMLSPTVKVTRELDLLMQKQLEKMFIHLLEPFT